MQGTTPAGKSRRGAARALALRVLLPSSALIGATWALRRWSLHFGAVDDEATAALPGDGLILHPSLQSTRAITIAADPHGIWPWVVQLGQSRGGFYSYSVLENLFGADIHNADEIVSEWQHLAVGDEIQLAPGMALGVVQVDPDHALVLRGGVPAGGAASPFEFTWAFVIRETVSGTSRLVVRERYGYTRRWAALMVEPTEMVSFLMSQRMLRGIRDRAERSPERTS